MRRPGIYPLAAALTAMFLAGPPAAAGDRPSGTPAACTHWKGVVPQDLHGLTLTDVAVFSPSLAWAVGSYSGEAPPKILLWNGSAWTDQEVRIPEGELNGVAAISATDTWAIGFDRVIEPMAVHWHGASWSKVPTPAPGSYHYMYDIDGAAPDDVWAVGDYSDAQGFIHPLAMHWDGVTWKVISVPEAPWGGTCSTPLTP